MVLKVCLCYEGYDLFWVLNVHSTKQITSTNSHFLTYFAVGCTASRYNHMIPQLELPTCNTTVLSADSRNANVFCCCCGLRPQAITPGWSKDSPSSHWPDSGNTVSLKPPADQPPYLSCILAQTLWHSHVSSHRSPVWGSLSRLAGAPLSGSESEESSSPSPFELCTTVGAYTMAPGNRAIMSGTTPISSECCDHFATVITPAQWPWLN